LNFSLLPIARPPLTMILAAVSSGRSSLAISLPTKLLQAAGRDGVDDLDRRRCRRWPPPASKAGGAHGDDLDRVAALHGGHRVAGVDRALEGVGVDDLGGVADLRHVEQAATRGATFLPPAVAGNRMWL
jgi:hypothetical protein